jgi:adenine-specific DNA-methyltransferase
VLDGAGLLGDGVKLVYLDPPFRTGKRFGAYVDQGDRAAWTAMMRETLTSVARVLRADGSVWVHLDDRETATARRLLDETFGAANFVADIVWERKRKPSFLHGQVAAVTDHIVVYAQDRRRLGRFITGEPVEARRVPLHHAGNAPATLTFPPGTVEMPVRDGVVPAGDMSTATVTTVLLADVRVAGGRNVDPVVMSGSWRWTQERLDGELAVGVLVRCPRLPLRPQAVTGSGSRTWTTLWSRANGMATNEDATEHAHVLFGDAMPFDTPKPEELLARIVETTTEPGDLVVDLFAGSGTTAAVAHKLGRRWVTVEASADVLARFTEPRLTQVVDGSDAGGISTRTTVASTVPLPDGWTARDARRAGQWVGTLAAAGALDFLPPDAREAVVAAVRQEAVVRTDRVWSGGGGFMTCAIAADVPAEAAQRA